jgi:hypothetical protein
MCPQKLRYECQNRITGDQNPTGRSDSGHEMTHYDAFSPVLPSAPGAPSAKVTAGLREEATPGLDATHFPAVKTETISAGHEPCAASTPGDPSQESPQSND